MLYSMLRTVKIRKMEWKLIDPDSEADDNVDLGSVFKEKNQVK
jgi:hypothetical protein